MFLLLLFRFHIKQRIDCSSNPSSSDFATSKKLHMLTSKMGTKIWPPFTGKFLTDWHPESQPESWPKISLNIGPKTVKCIAPSRCSGRRRNITEGTRVKGSARIKLDQQSEKDLVATQRDLRPGLHRHRHGGRARGVHLFHQVRYEHSLQTSSADNTQASA